MAKHVPPDAKLRCAHVDVQECTYQWIYPLVNAQKQQQKGSKKRIGGTQRGGVRGQVKHFNIARDIADHISVCVIQGRRWGGCKDCAVYTPVACAVDCE